MIVQGRYAGCQDFLELSQKGVSEKIPYNTFASNFSIKTLHHENEWEFPKIINDTWQVVSVKINLESIVKFVKDPSNIDLLLFSKSLKRDKIEPFKHYIYDKKSVNREQNQVEFTCRFKIDSNVTSFSGKKVFLIGLLIENLTVKYLATDILVGSNQSQTRLPYNAIGKEMQAILEQKTFWFKQSKNPQEPVQKKVKPEIPKVPCEITEDFLSLACGDPNIMEDLEGNCFFIEI